MWRSTVLSRPLPLVFPAEAVAVCGLAVNFAHVNEPLEAAIVVAQCPILILILEFFCSEQFFDKKNFRKKIFLKIGVSVLSSFT
jgi:hypothetical protein